MKAADDLTHIPYNEVNTQNGYIKIYSQRMIRNGSIVNVSRNDKIKTIGHELGHILFGIEGIHLGISDGGILDSDYQIKISADDNNLMRWGDYSTLDNLTPQQLMGGLYRVMNDLKSNVVPKGGGLSIGNEFIPSSNISNGVPKGSSVPSY